MWIPLSVAAILIIWFVWYPHLPPGRMSDAASGQQFDIAVLAVTAAPVVIGVLLYMVYAVVVWRARPGDDSDGPPIHGHTGPGLVDHHHLGGRAVGVRVRHPTS